MVIDPNQDSILDTITYKIKLLPIAKIYCNSEQIIVLLALFRKGDLMLWLKRNQLLLSQFIAINHDIVMLEEIYSQGVQEGDEIVPHLL